APVRNQLLKWLSSGPKEYNGDFVLKDKFGIPGIIVRISVVDKDKATLEIHAERKAFKLVLDKDALLPGMHTGGSGDFEPEQELHGLEAVRPWDIKSTHTAESLAEQFPEVGGPAQKAASTP